MRKTGSGEIR